MPGDISQVPYAEPTWLNDGYYSPYFKEVRTLFCWKSVTRTYARWNSHIANCRRP